MAEYIKLRNGTASAWDSAAPTLLQGEVGLETDTRRIKVGDGSTAWASLSYWNYPKMAAKSADYTITDDDADVFEITTGATDRTVTLPTLADNTGRIIRIVKADSGSGKVTIDGEGAETIDGETTIDIDSQYDYALVQAGASSWYLLEYKDHGSNANGEWVRFADGSLVMTLWGFVNGDGTNHYEQFVDKAVPVTPSSILSVTVGCGWYKNASDPTTRHDRTSYQAQVGVTPSWDGSAFDGFVYNTSGSPLTSGRRFIYTLTVNGTWR